MNDKSDDMALEALLAAASKIASDIDLEVLKKAYAIERTYQFDLTRDVPHKNLQKLVDDIVTIGSSS